jgi:hypothetical protein
MEPLYAIVASGFNISGNIDLRKRALIGIHVPVLGASGDLAIQGNLDTTSATFLRYMETRVGSGDLRFGTGLGSRYVALPPMLETLPYARLEIVGAAGSMQSDNRTFTLVTRPR